jgi:uncharacterized membrane protein
MVKPYHRQQCKLYVLRCINTITTDVPVQCILLRNKDTERFETNYIAANLHSFRTIHKNAALKEKNVRLFMTCFRRTIWLNILMTDVLCSFSVLLSVVVKQNAETTSNLVKLLIY